MNKRDIGVPWNVNRILVRKKKGQQRISKIHHYVNTSAFCLSNILRTVYYRNVTKANTKKKKQAWEDNIICPLSIHTQRKKWPPFSKPVLSILTGWIFIPKTYLWVNKSLSLRDLCQNPGGARDTHTRTISQAPRPPLQAVLGRIVCVSSFATITWLVLWRTAQNHEYHCSPTLLFLKRILAFEIKGYGT